jgi:hypothetical protein
MDLEPSLAAGADAASFGEPAPAEERDPLADAGPLPAPASEPVVGAAPLAAAVPRVALFGEAVVPDDGEPPFGVAAAPAPAPPEAVPLPFDQAAPPFAAAGGWPT